MTGRTILVVDDEFGILALLDAVLEDEGYRVVTAANGRAALDWMAGETPDLVITDMAMPVMDGAALITAMAADPALAGVRTVVMSSLPEASIAERCSGYAAFLRKPFRIAEAVARVTELLAVPAT